MTYARKVLVSLAALSWFLFVFFDVLFQAPRVPNPEIGAVLMLETMGGVSYVSELGWYLHYALLTVGVLSVIGLFFSKCLSAKMLNHMNRL